MATLLLEDNFNYLDTNLWRTTLPWGDRERVNKGEFQYYEDDAITIRRAGIPNNKQHILRITATNGYDSGTVGADYKSGFLTTNEYDSPLTKGFRHKYFYAELSAKIPKGAGLWPAFWLLADGRTGPSWDGTYLWPPEIDIMEVLCDNTKLLRLHSHANSTNDANVDDDGDGQNVTVRYMHSRFNKFAIDWQSDFITWYFNDQEVFQVVTPTQLTLYDMYININLAIGGWAGTPDESAFPAHFDLNYLRVYDVKP